VSLTLNTSIRRTENSRSNDQSDRHSLWRLFGGGHVSANGRFASVSLTWSFGRLAPLSFWCSWKLSELCVFFIAQPPLLRHPPVFLNYLSSSTSCRLGHMHMGATWILRLECAGTAPRGFPLTAAAGSETIESSEPGQRPTRAPLDPTLPLSLACSPASRIGKTCSRDICYSLIGPSDFTDSNQHSPLSTAPPYSRKRGSLLSASVQMYYSATVMSTVAFADRDPLLGRQCLVLTASARRA